MTATIAGMSVGQLRELIEDVLDEKLVDILGDPDPGFSVRPEVREQLLVHMERVRHADY
jgi:hypothetical protein